MKFTLLSLTLALRRGDEVVPLRPVSYFWGQMGAGKTSIARLIDYCLGGDIELTPALQSEFVGATLKLSLTRAEVTLERPRDADRVIASWGIGEDAFQVSLPVRDAAGEVVPDTGVETLSDLLFWLSDIAPPRVRRSKTKMDSAAARLSIRDLLWYCYLDQDEIDSSFFHLEEGGHPFKRLKSRDVLRFVIGFHSERLAEIETALDQLRGERLSLVTTIASLSKALAEAGVASEVEIVDRIRVLREAVEEIEREIEAVRTTGPGTPMVHAADALRAKAQDLGQRLAAVDTAISDLREVQGRDQRHLHEIETLALKFRRSASARAVLSGVAFEACPRCAQSLPLRGVECCAVCGQVDRIETSDPGENALVERDAKARVAELADILARHTASLERLQREREELIVRKDRVERERNEALRQYDTAYLSTMLAKERERAALLQQIEGLGSLMRLPRLVESQRERLAEVEAKERRLRSELKDARAEAESETAGIEQLKEFFLDCLVRSGIPGIDRADRVELPLPSFFPEVYGPDAGDATVTSFATLSSGGKKTLFKACFAVAVHRLATQLGATLPRLLIVDSPMKNISERENREQFEGFYGMLYELAAGELAATQMIFIDKEFSPAPPSLGIEVAARHMRPGDPENPPLIPYYRGK